MSPSENNPGPAPVVLKFGGAALADAAKITAAVSRVRGAGPGPVAVVVSAVFGVTDALLAAADAAIAGDAAAAEDAAAAMAARHRALAGDLVPAGAARDELVAELDPPLARLARTLAALAVLGEGTPRARAAVAATGERLSARLFAAALREAGTPSEVVDGEEVVVTDGPLDRAEPRPGPTAARLRDRLAPPLAAGVVPVVMGFVGADAAGRTATLGRGGTDLTASLAGAALGAREVRFMKEVAGILTADPRRVPAARRLPSLTYDEVAELSYFGAKVLHPVAIHPLRAGGIPARILDVRDPAGPGTRVDPTPEAAAPGVRALTGIPDVALLSVGGDGLQGVVGFAGRAFSALAGAGVNVLMISQGSSERSISVVLPAADLAAAAGALEAEFELEMLKGGVDPLRTQGEVAAVAVVGEGMRGLPGVAGRIFTALGAAGINVNLIAQGSSERNISFLVDGPRLDAALGCLHDAFGLGAA